MLVRGFLFSSAVFLSATLHAAPRISEFLAANRTGIQDQDGEHSDWIELHNPGPDSVNLEGWTLTDDDEEPRKWALPRTELGANAYLVVFASGKDRGGSDATTAGEPHTNFRLDPEGEFLALVPPSGSAEPADGFFPRFPGQVADIAYGRAADGTLRYFETPTPGNDNGTSGAFPGFVETPEATVPRGLYTEPFSLELSTRTPGAELFYTLDGSAPTREMATPYEAPMRIDGSARRAVTTLRVVAFADGFLPSRVATFTYIDPQQVLLQPDDPDGFPRVWGSAPSVDYEMDPDVIVEPESRARALDGLLDLPSLSIVMENAELFGETGIYSNPQAGGFAWERDCSAELIFPDGRPGFGITCGLRIQGGASRQPQRSPKHSLRLLFKGIYGPTELRFPWFGDDAASRFDAVTLRAYYNNSWISEDGQDRRRAQLARDQFHRDTQLAMGQVSSHGEYVHVYLNGLYWGIYNAVERPNARFGASYLGGPKDEYDAINSGSAIDGNLEAWNQLMALVDEGFETDAAFQRVRDLVDLPAFVDYMLLNFYGGNTDWPHHNWYALRRRVPGGRFSFVSWDAERTLEDPFASVVGVDAANSPGILYARLRGHPEFRRLFGDRAHRHLFHGGALTPESVIERWMERARSLDRAIVCESARWGDYRGPARPLTREEHWLVEQRRLTEQVFPRRSGFVLAQLRPFLLYPRVEAPVLSQHGGAVTSGFLLSMSLQEKAPGTIYFTVDGPDPRVELTGDITPTATVYTDPVALSAPAVIRARTLAEDGSWSAVTAATFEIAKGGLQRAGDCNQDGRLNLVDAICLFEVLTLGTRSLPCAGDDATLPLADLNGDRTVDLSDVVYLLNHLFLGGPRPAAGNECTRVPGCPDACTHG